MNQRQPATGYRMVQPRLADEGGKGNMKTKKNEKPNCYECVHRLTIPGDCHSRCNNHKAVVQGNMIGIRKGWFRWPLNFDPVWLISCDGFSTEEADRKPMVKLDPLVELFAMLR